MTTTSIDNQVKVNEPFKIIYNGKFTFCYAACLSMLLEYKGINLSIPYLENITTMSYGFFYNTYEKYFELFIGCTAPSIGLKIAGQTLGFKVTQKSFETSDEAKNYLDKIIKETPVIIGPVNMGTLPNHAFKHIPPGADHYILALKKINDSEYLINDPEGFIGIPIGYDELEKVWRGDEIGYTDSKYILTYFNERIKNPSEKEIFKLVLNQGFDNLETKILSPTFMKGAGCLEKFLQDIEQGLFPNFDEILDGFQLEMSNQRCYASAQFLDKYDEFHPLVQKASEIRYKQAILFGNARIFALKNKKNDLLDILRQEQILELEFHNLIKKILQEII